MAAWRRTSTWHGG
jgi:hypothetical protein